MYCLNCGIENNESADFCQNCGASGIAFKSPFADYDEITQVSRSFSRPTKSNNPNIILIIAGIIVAVAVGAVGYFYAKSEIKQSEAVVQKSNTAVPTSTPKTSSIEKPDNNKQENTSKQPIENENKELQKQEELGWKEFDVIIESEAKRTAQPSHLLSNIEETTQTSNNIDSKTDNEVIFTRVFNCRIRGKIRGKNVSDVGIEIRAKFSRKGDFPNQILSRRIIYDRKVL